MLTENLVKVGYVWWVESGKRKLFSIFRFDPP
jgi:hypothetical protein